MATELTVDKEIGILRSIREVNQPTCFIDNPEEYIVRLII